MSPLPRWEVRMRGNAPKFADIMHPGSADSAGAIARVPLRDGFTATNLREAQMIAGAPAMLAALKRIRDHKPGVLIADLVNEAIRIADPEGDREARSRGPAGDATAERDAGAPSAVAGIPCAGRPPFGGPSSAAAGRLY